MCRSITVTSNHSVMEDSRRYGSVINPLPIDKFLDWSKLKAFADRYLPLDGMNSMMDRRSRLSGKRRSSILKIDLNREDETTGILFNKSRGQSRRVSFAETAQIKEFPRDSPRVWRQESNEDDQDKDNEPSRSTRGAAGNASLIGLDSLLHGTVEDQSYQNIIHCPIPEMSIDSFSVCDENKTVLKPVDMETTLCIEPGMPFFPSEPSMEIKFDASSFLASLRGTQQSLSPTKLYSQQKESLKMSPPMSLISREQTEQENLPSTMKGSQQGGSQVKLMDSKSFLSNLFGAKGRDRLSDLHGSHYMENDEMDETACLDSVISSQTLPEDKENQHPLHLKHDKKSSNSVNKTVLGDTLAGVDETRCIGGILTHSDIIRNTEPVMNFVPNEDKTKYFEENEDTDKMEETKCHGHILKGNEASLREKCGLSETRTTVTGNKTISGDVLEFEETTCIGGIISNVDKENVPISVRMSQVRENDKTRYFGENETMNVMEETKCVGKIMECEISSEKVQNTFISEKEDGDKTRYYHGQDDGMEETICVDINNPSNICINNSRPTTNTDSNQTIFFTSDAHQSKIEETACIGGILRNNPNTSEVSDTGVDKTPEESNKTRYFTENQITCIMDETTCAGGLMQALPMDVKLNSSLEVLKTASCLEKSKTGFEMEEGNNEKKEIITNEDKEINKSKKRPARPSNDTLNHTKYFADSGLPEGMEETKCIGGLVDKTFSGIRGDNNQPGTNGSGLISELESHDFHNTKLANVTMEETKCIGGMLKDDISVLDVNQAYLNNSQLYDSNTNLQREKRTNKVSSMQETEKCYSKEACSESTKRDETQDLKRTCAIELKHDDANIVVEAVANHDQVCPDKTESEVTFKTTVKRTASDRETEEIDPETDVYHEHVCPDITDTEIRFKSTVKRTASEIKTDEMDGDKTKELTDTAMKKIKGMLMMSAQKTASHIKAGIIKTPAKPSPDDLGNLSTGKSMKTDFQTLSPVHKRIRLFEPGAREVAKAMDDFGVCPMTELEVGLEKGLDIGIEEETMPECMQTEILSTVGDDDTTILESGVNLNATQSVDDSKTNSSGNLSNMSMLWNRSILAKPTVVPDGPLSLETFFKLTAKPLSCISGGRYSIPFTQKIDYDCLEEVLEAEIVNRPLVEAKKSLHKRITERQHKNEDNVVWLQKTLEETQPQIFQDVARGDTEEIKDITEKLFTLFSCCSKEANVIWKQETKKMFDETVDKIQDEELKRAENMLDDLKTTSVEVDQLLDSLDNDLEELEKAEELLKELEDRESTMKSELCEIHIENEKNQIIVEELKCRHDKDQENLELQRTRVALRQRILQQLMLVDWNLDEFYDSCIVTSFLEGEIRLKINFEGDQNKKFIKDIDFQISSEPCPWLHKRMARSLMLVVLDKDCLLQQPADFESLPKMLQEISVIVSEISKITTEVGELNKKHKLSWTNNVLSFEIWNSETLRMVKVMLTYPTEATTAFQPEISVKRQIGMVSETEIESSLREIKLCSPYLQRLVQIVETKLKEPL